MSISSVSELLYQNKWILERLPQWSNIPEIRVWSDSDLPKLMKLIESLTKDWIWYILRVQSAHRMPGDMMASAKAFPEILLSEYLPNNLRDAVAWKNLKVALCIAAAWGSAHIAWMTASETQIPVVAYPVPASATWQISAFYSMIDMPPWIPNWVQTDLNSIFETTKKLLKLKKDWKRPKIYIPHEIQSLDKISIINELTKFADLVEIPESADIWIHTVRIDTKWQEILPNNWVNVIIPTVENPITFENLWETYKNATWLNNWLLMWQSIESNINATNSLLYLAQLVSMISWEEAEELLNWLKNYRNWLTTEARLKDSALLDKQF